MPPCVCLACLRSHPQGYPSLPALAYVCYKLPTSINAAWLSVATCLGLLIVPVAHGVPQDKLVAPGATHNVSCAQLLSHLLGRPYCVSTLLPLQPASSRSAQCAFRTPMSRRPRLSSTRSIDIPPLRPLSAAAILAVLVAAGGCWRVLASRDAAYGLTLVGRRSSRPAMLLLPALQQLPALA